MKIFFASTVCAAILFAGCGAATETVDTAQPATEVTDTSTTVSTTETADIQTLMRENAQLMVQAGSVGIDAQQKQEWVMQGQSAAQKLATQDYAGAAEILTALNEEMRAEIAAVQE